LPRAAAASRKTPAAPVPRMPSLPPQQRPAHRSIGSIRLRATKVPTAASR
jgi:hypothetical protein